MPTLRTDALVLRSVDFSEADRILHLLVPELGRITVIAKHARRSVKRFAGTLDLFNHLSVHVETRRPGAVHRLDQARLVRSFEPLRTDPARFALGCYLLEMLDRLAPEGGNRTDMQRLFAFALAALDWLAARPPDAKVRTFLELRALDALGLRPELRRCVRCGREPEAQDEVDFDVPDGGPVCATCAQRRTGLLRLHRGTLRALEQGLAWDLARIDRLVLSKAALAEARRLVSRFQRFHVGVELASERFLRDMLTSDDGADPGPEPAARRRYTARPHTP